MHPRPHTTQGLVLHEELDRRTVLKGALPLGGLSALGIPYWETPASGCAQSAYRRLRPSRLPSRLTRGARHRAVAFFRDSPCPLSPGPDYRIELARALSPCSRGTRSRTARNPLHHEIRRLGRPSACAVTSRLMVDVPGVFQRQRSRGNSPKRALKKQSWCYMCRKGLS